ncbi:MAG TPA: putative nucleotidyltransferase substrate binding domain-containing protein [Candidatus Nanopelagicales bacterium]
MNVSGASPTATGTAQEPGLITAARRLDLAAPGHGSELAEAADARTRDLVDGFVHQAGPAPGRFAWVALGSHARGELHCASDQDHALIWDTDRAAASSYAGELAASVIAGLAAFGLRRCDGGYMADHWSLSLADWVTQARDRIEAPTPEAVLETDVFLDLRPLAGSLDVAPAVAVQLRGADSPRLMHGLALAATSFPAPRLVFGRLPHGPLDVKRTGLAPIVLLARLYALRARSGAVATPDRLVAAREAGVLSTELAERLRAGHDLLTRLRLHTQLAQVAAGLPVSDRVVVGDLDEADQHGLRDALRAVRSAQTVTAVAFRTDLSS